MRLSALLCSQRRRVGECPGGFPSVSKGLATAADLERSDAPRLASSAVVIGEPSLGARSLLSEGAVLRAEDGAVTIGAGSAVIENCVVIGTTAGTRSCTRF